jgi:hypothetical protein
MGCYILGRPATVRKRLEIPKKKRQATLICRHTLTMPRCPTHRPPLANGPKCQMPWARPHPPPPLSITSTQHPQTEDFLRPQLAQLPSIHPSNPATLLPTTAPQQDAIRVKTRRVPTSGRCRTSAVHLQTRSFLRPVHRYSSADPHTDPPKRARGRMYEEVDGWAKAGGAVLVPYWCIWRRSTRTVACPDRLIHYQIR